MREADPGQSQVLQQALEAFLDHGFHAVSPEELEAATGRTWDDLTRPYGDKEGLFLAAVEQGLMDGSVAELGKEAEVLKMLQRLQRVNGNPRLRAIHKQALTSMQSVAETRTARG